MDTPEGLYGRGRESAYGCWPTWMPMPLLPVYTLLAAPGSPWALLILEEALMLSLFDIAILYALLEFLEFLMVFWSTQGTSSSLG